MMKPIPETRSTVVPLPERVEDWPLAAIEAYRERLAIQLSEGTPEAEARITAQAETRTLFKSGASVDPRRGILSSLVPMLEQRFAQALLSAKGIYIAVNVQDEFRVQILMDSHGVRSAEVTNYLSPREIVKAVLRKNSWTTADVAEKAKVHEQTVYRIMRGSCKVGSEARERVAKVLQCDPGLLKPTTEALLNPKA